MGFMANQPRIIDLPKTLPHSTYTKNAFRNHGYSSNIEYATLLIYLRRMNMGNTFICRLGLVIISRAIAEVLFSYKRLNLGFELEIVLSDSHPND